MSIEKIFNPKNLSQPVGPPYRGANNKRLTQSLFFETYKKAPRYAPNLPIFCLKHNWDTRRVGMVEVYSTFIEERDPTGYKWAIKYLGDYEDYKRLMNTKWFSEFIENEVLPDLAQIMKSEAIARVREIMESGSDSQSLAAAKYIAEEKWKPSRGRPSKDEIYGNLVRASKAAKEELEDSRRIGLVVDNTKEKKNAN